MRPQGHAHTVTALDKVFGTDAFFEFYEQLFNESAIRRLCDHLGIDMHPAAFETRKNASATDNALTPEDRALFAWFNRKSYAFCAQRFGHSLIERIWNPPEPRAGKPPRAPRPAPAAGAGAGTPAARGKGKGKGKGKPAVGTPGKPGGPGVAARAGGPGGAAKPGKPGGPGAARKPGAGAKGQGGAGGPARGRRPGPVSPAEGA